MKITTMTSDRIPLWVEFELKGDIVEEVVQNRMVANAFHRATFFDKSKDIQQETQFEDFVSMDACQEFTLLNIEYGEQADYMSYFDHLNNLLDHDIIALDDFRDCALELLQDTSSSWKLAYVVGMTMMVTYIQKTLVNVNKHRAFTFLIPMWLMAYNYLVHGGDIEGVSALLDRVEDESSEITHSHVDVVVAQHIAAASALINE